MDDTFVGMILQKLDDAYLKASIEKGWWSYVKCFLIGMAMGIIDGAVVVGIAFSLWGWISKIFKKKGR